MPLRGIGTLLLCGLLAAAGCQRAPTPAPAVTVSEPAAAVQRLARHLHDNDLVAFARDAVPPADYTALEAAWREGRSRWPLTELPLDEQLEPLLATLSAADSERRLKQGFKRNFANQDKDLRDAARSLGSFGVQYVKREGVYTAEERAHYAQVITALSEWAAQAPLGDPKRGATAIQKLAAAARRTGLTSEQALREAGMGESLRRLGPLLAQAKATLASYGLSLDRSLSGLRTELVEQKGDQARVRIHYPLGKREIDTVVSLQRRDGHWYLADDLRHAEQALAAPAGDSQQAPAQPN
jgi:chorismate mutase